MSGESGRLASRRRSKAVAATGAAATPPCFLMGVTPTTPPFGSSVCLSVCLSVRPAVGRQAGRQKGSTNSPNHVSLNNISSRERASERAN